VHVEGQRARTYSGEELRIILTRAHDGGWWCGALSRAGAFTPAWLMAVTAACAQPMVVQSMMRIRVSRAGRCGAAGLSRYHTRIRSREKVEDVS